MASGLWRGGHGRRAANLTFRIFVEFERAPFHTQTVEHQKPPVQGLAAAGQDLDRLRCLHGAYDADQRREHAHDGAAGFFEFVIFREKAVVARAVVVAHVEHGNLAVETDARAGHQRLSVLDAGAIYRVTGVEIVAAIENHIGLGDALFERLAGKPLRDGDDVDVGVNFQQRATR